MKKNKLAIIIGILAILLIVSGIVASKMLNKNGDFPLFNSDIEYIEYEGNKIYLAQKIEDFVLQFKGLGCKMENNNKSIEIDSINSKDHEFYKLSGGNNYGNNVICVINNNKLTFHYLPSFDNGLKIYEMDSIYYHISGTEGYGNLVINGKEIFIGYNRTLDSKSYNDLLKVVPNNYEMDREVNTPFSQLKYKKNDVNYSYLFVDKDGQEYNNLISVGIIREIKY